MLTTPVVKQQIPTVLNEKDFTDCHGQNFGIDITQAVSENKVFEI